MPSRLDLIKQHSDLIKAIRDGTGGLNPGVVILDTLNRSLVGSESSDEDMSKYVQAADAIREAFNCLVIVIHHSGHNTTRPRGHTSLVGAIDAQISVKRDFNTIIATVELMKDGPEGEVIASRLDKVDVGTDENGETISSCVIVETEASKAASGGRLSGQNRVAFDLLTQAAGEHGEYLNGSDHIPSGIRCVTMDLWRKYFYAGAFEEADTPDTKRQAFNRAAKKLQALGKIGSWNEWVWPMP